MAYFREGVSTVTGQTGETSFHLHSLVESFSNLHKCRDYEVKTHLNFFLKDQENNSICHCLGLYSVQIAFRYFIRNTLCVSFHPHWILSSSLTPWPGLSAPCSKQLPLLKLWGCRISPLWTTCHRLGDSGSSRHFQTWMKYHTKGHRSRLPG